MQELIVDNDFEVIQQAEDTRNVRLYSSECNRPGLQLCGFYTKFVPDRIQVIGGAEWCYLEGLDPKVRDTRLKAFFEHKITVLVITKNQRIFPEMITYAKENNCTILRTPDSTSLAVYKLITYLERALAPSLRKHGILLDVYGVGVLIIGESGIGKSETALDLIVSGHKLIADDSVLIRMLDNRLIGTSPKITRHFMEIRGIGIIDVERLLASVALWRKKK